MDSNKRPTQADRIVKYIKDFGSITRMDAINDLGIVNLPGRISEIKDRGIPINDVMEKGKNRYNEVTYHKRYSFAEGYEV